MEGGGSGQETVGRGGSRDDAAPFAPAGAAERIDMAVALARCRIERDRCRAELEAVRAERDRRTYEIAQLTRICRRHEAAIAALRASTSWRLTAPLRRAITLVWPRRPAAPDAEDPGGAPEPPEAAR